MPLNYRHKYKMPQNYRHKYKMPLNYRHKYKMALNYRHKYRIASELQTQNTECPGTIDTKYRMPLNCK